MASLVADNQAGSGRERRAKSLLPDPGYLWMIFRRRMWLFLGVVALVLGGTVAVLLTLVPRYTAIASVLIEPRNKQVIDMGSVVSGLPADTNVIDTEAQLIGSPTVLLAVVRGLHLDRDPAFVGPNAPVPAAARTTGDGVTAAERAALEALSRTVYVKRAGLTYVIDIAAASTSPDMAANIANAVARSYISLQNARLLGTNQQAADWVQKRAEALRQQAVADDAALQRYMIQHNLMSAEGATMAEQQVSQLGQQIAQAQASLAQERGRLAAAQGQVARGGGGADIGAALSSETISNLRQQEATATASLAQLQARYGDRHPEVVKAKDQVADIRGQLSAELGRIRSTLGANVSIAQSGLNSLIASQARARATLASNSQAQVGLAELKRKAEASSTIYNAFLARAKETQAQTSLPKSDASISTLARVPDRPTSPNKRLGLVFGLIVALLLGTVAVAAAEYLDSTLATGDDVEDELGVRYLGGVPDLRSTLGRGRGFEPPHLYVLDHPFSTFSESLRNLASTLKRPDTGQGQVIAITSALPKEGKSTLAVAMARVLASGGRRVILIDGDLRRHSVSDMVAREALDERLLRVVSGAMPLAQGIVKDGATELRVLPTRGPTGPDDHLSSERVAALFAALRRDFDTIIVDTAPVLGVAETRELTRHADSTLLIARWRETDARAVRGALDILAQTGATVAGVALTLVDIRRYASTGMSDAYGYHKKFTGYYVN